jgi:tetratricopeptide (TPR) repeat protein
MSSSKSRSLIVATLVVLLAAPVLAGSATVKMKVANDQGAPIREAVFVFSNTEDAQLSFNVDENEAGSYETKVKLPVDDATWSLTRIVTPGYLPIKVDLKSTSGDGEVLQEVTGMVLNPANPVPPVRIVASGRVEIDLVLGDQQEVMRQFREARAAARAEAEKEAAELNAAAQGPYAEALRAYSAGDVAGSLPHFEQAMQENPDDLEMHTTYANVLYKAKRFEEFAPVAQRVVELEPKNANMRMMMYSAARSRNDMDGALEALLGIKELGGDASLVPHLTFVAQTMGEKKAAIPAYEAILDLDRKNGKACLGLASIYTTLGDETNAQNYLARAIEFDPSSAPELYYDMATKLLAQSDPSPADVTRACELLEDAIGLAPEYADAYKKLGLARWKQEDYPATRQAFEKYLELAPDAADKDKVADYIASLPEE